MINLLDLAPADARNQVQSWIVDRGEPSYRVAQITPRLWQRPISMWEEATDLPKDLRDGLQGTFPLTRPELVRREDSVDGTVKFLWRFNGEALIESVWIPDGRRRRTLCISSQEGCAYGCRFCATGRMGFQRHLRPSEIAGQVRELMLMTELPPPTNVVFMGMGEPLHNWRSVDTALTILNDPSGLGIGARHITVSTIGITPTLAKLAARPEQFVVAWSLHAATSEVRTSLMPIEQKYPMSEVQEALKAFRRRVTLEYVMIDGINDADHDARALGSIARDLGAHVNLLPLHPGGASDLGGSTPERIRTFAAFLRSERVKVTVRVSRGLDINAACGQLRTIAGGLGVPAKNNTGVD